MMFKEFLIWTLWGQNVGPGWVKNGKKFSFTPATLLSTQFSLKTKFLTAIVLLSKLKVELTDLHKILQKFIFYWN